MGVEAPNAGVAIGPIVAGGMPSHMVGIEPGSGLGSIRAEVLGGVNEGPVTSLEDTMIITNRFNQVGEIRFNPPVEDAPPVVTSVIEHPESKARRIWEEVRYQPPLTSLMVERVFLVAEAMGRSRSFYGWAQAETQTTPLAAFKPEAQARPAKQYSKSVSYPSVQPILVEQARHGEEVTVEIGVNPQKISNIVEEQERLEVRKRFVLDEQTQSKRVNLVIEAVNKAKEQALRLGVKITGSMIGKYLIELFSRQNSEVESEAVRGKGPDGSLPKTKEAIEAYGEYTSDSDAEEKSIKEVFENIPIKIRENGKTIRKENIDIVYDKHKTKPKGTEVVVEIFRRRKIKKGPGPAEIVKSEQVEGRIEDTELAGVFNFKQAA